MGGFNGGNGKNSGHNRKNINRSSFKNRLFIERNVESLEDRQMLDGSGVLSNFGDYYLFQGQKQSILRSGTELVVQFEQGKRDIIEFQLLFPGGILTGFTKSSNLGYDAAVYRRDVNPNQSNADQVLSLLQIAGQVKQTQGVRGAGPAFSGQTPGSELYILNEMYVGLKAGVSADTFFKTLPDVSSWKKIRGSANDYVVGLKLNLGVETLTYAANLASNPSVVYSEPNSWAKVSKAALPNDPYLGLEWQIQNTGQGGGTAGADINAVTAWNRGVTGTGVVIAVIDDGVQLAHPDLATNISINTNEIPNDGIDNDNNGYIDDVNGWDFADNDNDPNPRLVDDAHGTTVAGLAAGVGNNAIGVAGVAYTSKILPIRVPFSGEPTTATAFIEAVYYAAGLDNGGNRVWRGADVLN
ncbi:MAG: S8 family serine peptidase, partial [Isosphaeraceae bacterium]